MTLKITIIGCVEFSEKVTRSLIKRSDIEIVGIVTLKKSSINSDFFCLEPLAKEINCPCLISEGNRQDDIATFLSKVKTDIAYCIGWSYLLQNQVLNTPPLGIVGFHPAALPLNRGRHPLIWALALGLNKTAATFFQMDEGADSGNILCQTIIDIGVGDTARTLYKKVTKIAIKQLKELTTQLIEDRAIPLPQDHSKANYWRKRGHDDGRIDWRMSAKSIHNLIRALSDPYIQAHFKYMEGEVKVKSAKISSNTLPNIEPGRVLAIEGNAITIACGDASSITLTEYELNELPEVGSCL
jgi:methionyl-tRNA formyltransferase